MDKIYTVKITLATSPNKINTYLSRIDSSPLGASAGPAIEFELPAVPNGMPDYTGFFRSLDLKKDKSEIIDELKNLGDALYKCIFKGPVNNKMQKMVGKCDADPGSKIRIALNILSPELINVPWEFLYADYNFLLYKNQYSIVRIIDELILPTKSIGPVSHPMIIVANPGELFNAARHIQTIKQVFVDAKIGEGNIAILEKATDSNIFSFLEQHPETDFLYYLGHGITEKNGDGFLIVETDNQQLPYKEIPARTIASAIRRQKKLQSVYLNSCLSSVDKFGTLAGVAQKILLDGDVVSVVAMQAEIGAEEGMTMAKTFIEGVTKMETIEVALQEAKAKFLDDDFTWGIPVIYTHIEDSEEYEKNQLLSLFSSRQKGETYALCIPSFKNTLLEEEIQQNRYDVTVRVNGKPIGDIYHYPGLSFAQSDVKAVGYIQSLLRNITNEDNILLIQGSKIEEENMAKCTFLFGSRSNFYVAQVSKGFQKIFELKYEAEWSITDIVYNKVYSLKPPYKSGHSQWASIQDYAFIQKIISQENVYFLICGLGDRGTEGASLWFKNHWKELLKQFGTNPFEIILRFPTVKPQDAVQIDRKTGSDLL
ncbi:MAG: CHAT domain-containing protein [Ginsengibacter sp.]